MLGVADLADGRAAVLQDQAYLARRQAQLRVLPSLAAIIA